MIRYFLYQLILVLWVLTHTTFTSRADVKLPRIFNSDMVLQKGIENFIWGWADNPDDLNLYNKEELPANPFHTDY